MQNTAKKLGANLRSMRRMRGMSAEDLALELTEKTGKLISGDTILSYETARRSMNAELLFFIADVLECSVQALIDGVDYRLGDVTKAKHEIARLSSEDHAIIRNIATNWDGNIHALIVAMGVYCSLPPHRRREALTDISKHLNDALNAREISKADLPEGIEDLEHEAGRLFNG